VETLNAEIRKYDATLSDPLLFAQDPAKGNAVAKKRAEAARKLKAAEERWIKFSEDYESALAAED
jgi:ATP-binding cassette subfamily F protein 3